MSADDGSTSASLPPFHCKVDVFPGIADPQAACSPVSEYKTPSARFGSRRQQEFPDRESNPDCLVRTEA